MTTKVGINGFGRIGRGVFRALSRFQRDRLEIGLINGSGDIVTKAHLLKWDSTYGMYPGEISAEDDFIVVDGMCVATYYERDASKIPWGEYGVEIVIDSTGAHRDGKQLNSTLENGAKKVLISAPAKNEDITLLLGINQDQYDPKKHNIISMASCTTNCVAPVIKVLHENFEVTKGFMTTIHAVTRDQQLQDKYHTDFRRARTAMTNIIPTSTGASKQVGKIITELDGKIDGISIRVPVHVGSVVDFVAVLGKGAAAEEVNRKFREAAEGELKGIMTYSEDMLVSSDFVGNSASSIFDAPSTMVIGENMIKVLSWYDNEWGYSCRLAELARMLAEKGL